VSGAKRAADFNVVWGEAGKIDKVEDVTHKVTVPFAADHLGGTWGILNQTAATAAGSFDARPELTLTDFGCVEPLKSYGSVQAVMGPCTAAAPYALSETAIPGPIAHFSPTLADAKTFPAAAGLGFAMYLAGDLFMFELPPGGTVPAAGTVWAMRSYIGAISGGNGDGGIEGPYKFNCCGPIVRTYSAVGTSFTVNYSVTNQVLAATDSGLKRVHTVPDPYYITSAFETTTEQKIIKFVNLPTDAIIRLYSSSGILVRVIEHHASAFGGDETWDVRNRNGQFVSSGVYFYHIEAGSARRVGRMTVVNFAQ
jgi:hypothetical protein